MLHAVTGTVLEVQMYRDSKAGVRMEFKCSIVLEREVLCMVFNTRSLVAVSLFRLIVETCVSYRCLDFISDYRSSALLTQNTAS